MTNPLLTFADLALGWHSRPLDEAVQKAARHALLDWFATTIPGTVRAPATLLANADMGTGSGGAICLTSGRATSPRQAAFVNAAASHTVEFDDIFRDGGYHPGSPTIAAALALAQDRNLPREAFDRAVIAGYEVGCRLALALQPAHYEYWHITATLGTIGAATSAALLLGCDRDQIAHAIAIASSFAGGHQQNLQGAGTAKALHPGHAAEAGLLAAYAARAGATGSLDALHGQHGYAAATGAGTGNWEAAFAGAGDWTPITRMTVKIHGCCGHVFPALDGIGALRQKHGFAFEDIEALLVEGYGATKSMCDRPDPQGAQEARFSLQYCLAAQLVLRSVRLDAFEEAALTNSNIRALMRRIKVERAEDLAAAYPARRMARLHLRLKDGRALDHFQPSRKGDPEDPVTPAELVAKFDELAGSVLDAASVEALRLRILDDDHLPAGLRPL